MARLRDRLPENAPGPLYVDASCIDCATCRIVAPDTFAPSPRGDAAHVARQPDGDGAWHRALMALVACPTSSIGAEPARDARAASRAFPEPVLPDVLYCGFADRSSYGASSYLIQRPEGNVLVDCPRAAGPIVARLEELGGVRYIFLTHRDDVGDHGQLAARFGATRILHAADVSGDTRDVEWKLAGHEVVAIAPDLRAIPVPGHTAGSVALLFRDDVLFTGDHLWATERSGRLNASRSVCWHSWPAQVASVRRLLDHRFSWVLPGHGMRFRAEDPAAMHAALEGLLRRLEAPR